MPNIRKFMLILVLSSILCIGLIISSHSYPSFKYTEGLKRKLDKSIFANSVVPPDTPTTPHPVVCEEGPKDHLLFLKTHKTGSSTVQNVLERYALKNDILVGLSRSTHMFHYEPGSKFHRSYMLPVPANRSVGMLMHHMVFNYEEVSAVLPPDSVYFTILRDPATQFESAFSYMKTILKSFQKADFKTWITSPEKYFSGKNDGQYWFVAKNGMTFDLGRDNLNESQPYIEKTIAEIDKIFDFVMIAEYFDMSMLLLKDLLCWSMDDLLYLSVNARKKPKEKEVDYELQKKIYGWNRADTALYRYYNDTFWRRVEAYGRQRMERDLAEYVSRKEKFVDFCVENNTYSNADIKDGKYRVYNPKGVTIEQYKLKEEAKNNETCVGMVLPELSWDRKLRQHFYHKN